MAEELPPVVTRLIADVSELEAGLAKGEARFESFKTHLTNGSGGVGEQIGREIGDGIGKGLGNELPKATDPPLEDFDKKTKSKTKETAKGAADGMSPLLIGAFSTAAALGPAALLAGTSLAVAGIGSLILKSNADIQAEYKTLAGDVGAVLKSAVTPLVPAVQSAMVSLDKSVTALGPVLAQTFQAAEPDIGAFTTGIEGLASHALPGLKNAIDGSRGIVSDFAGSLPKLGDGVSSFFQGIAKDSQTTGQGIASAVSIASTALGTLGHAFGAAAADASALLTTVTPALNGVLGAVSGLSSPATVGGLLGLFGAMKVDPAISSGLQNVSNRLTSVAAKAEGSAGAVGKLGGVAERAAGGFGAMADVMGGPWGLAIGAGIGLLGGLVSSMDKSIATASDFTAAVAADSGVVGANTTQIIQQKLAAIDLSKVQKDLGVSQATLIEYAAGEKDAQAQVAAAYDAKTAALEQTAGVTEHYGKVNYATSNASQAEIDTLAQTKDKIDQVTQAVADAIKQQDEQNRSYLAATHSAGIFAGMVDTATTALQTQATQAGITAVAALGLGSDQAQLSQDLADGVTKYQEATAGASGYNTVLQSLSGTTNMLLAAEAGFTIALHGVTTAAKANGLSLDVNNDKGAANIQTFTGLAASAQKAADAVYQNEVQTKGAAQAYDDANAKLAQEKQAFIAAADKAGFNKDQVKALADELYQLPKDIPIGTDVGPALKGLRSLIDTINTSSGTVRIYENSSGQVYSSGGGNRAFADGGWVDAPPGAAVPATVHGREYVLSQGMIAGRDPVDPQVLSALRSDYRPAAATGGGFAGPGPGGGAGAPVTVVQVYLDGKQITSGVRSSSQQYKVRNSLTGLT